MVILVFFNPTTKGTVALNICFVTYRDVIITVCCFTQY